MRSSGFIRRVDELGRIVLPVDLRRIFGIEVQDEIEIFVDEDRIVLKKIRPVCAFCGSSEDLFAIREKNICRKCLEQIRKL